MQRQLTDRIGGLTAFTRAPAEGRWAEDLDRSWWQEYRAGLERRFSQELGSYVEAVGGKLELMVKLPRQPAMRIHHLGDVAPAVRAPQRRVSAVFFSLVAVRALLRIQARPRLIIPRACA